MSCPAGRLQLLYIYLVWWSIFNWFVNSHAYFVQCFINGVYNFTTSKHQPGKIFALEQREKTAPCLLCSDNCSWHARPHGQPITPCASWGQDPPASASWVSVTGWQPWDARLYPCALNKTQDSPNQDQEIWMHLWSYLNLCGSRGISSVRGMQKLCGSVSLLSLSFAPFTQNQMHTHYAHRWNTTQRILRQELFPVLGFTLALFLYFVQFFGDLQFL